MERTRVSNLAFLQSEWPAVFEAAGKAEAAVNTDPRTACFYARRALELAVAWAYKHDPALKLPYQDNLSALIHEPSFKQAAGEAVFHAEFVSGAMRNGVSLDKSLEAAFALRGKLAPADMASLDSRKVPRSRTMAAASMHSDLRHRASRGAF